MQGAPPALKEREPVSFDEAQKDATLASPLDDELSTAMANHLNVAGGDDGSIRSSSTDEGQRHAPPATQSNGVRQEHEQYEQASEEYRRARDVERRREIQREGEREEEKRLAKRREKEKEQKRAAEAREAVKVARAIEEAIRTRKLINQAQKRLYEEAARCSEWTYDTTGNEALGRQVHGLWQTTRPTKQQLQMRETLVRDVQNAIEQRWPSCGLVLVPFGSTRTGLIEASSDVDLMLLDPTRPYGVGTPLNEIKTPPPGATFRLLADPVSYGLKNLPDYYSVRSLSRALDRFGKRRFGQVIPISKAIVPIVKLTHTRSGLSGDININDSFGSVNSELIRAYCEVAPEIVRPFLFAIKKWASRRGINDPAGKSGFCSFNSYTVCLIAIQFLQINGVVPNLQSPDLIAALGTQPTCLWQKPRRSRQPMEQTQEIKVDEETGARRFTTTFARIDQPRDIVKVAQTARSQVAANSLGFQDNTSLSGPMLRSKVGQLVRDFFIWLSTFDFQGCGFSIRMGTPFRKFPTPSNHKLLSFPYLEPPSREWKRDEPIVCQDPFILDRNTSGAIKTEIRGVIVDECWRARALLEEGGDNTPTMLIDLLEDYELDQMTRNHRAVMESFDAASQQLVIQRATTLLHR